MGLVRMLAERDFPAIVRASLAGMRVLTQGWDERDVISLSQRLYDPVAFSGGIIRITRRECRALPELNRRVMASTKGALLYPFLAWVEGRGLYPLRRAA